MVETNHRVELSAIIPVGSRHVAAADLVAQYRAGLDALNEAYELIFVLDGPQVAFEMGLREVLGDGQNVTMISLTRPFGESTALMVGFEHSSGQTILTLPAYYQIEPQDIGRLVDALQNCDLAVARRWPRAGGTLERIRRAVFHGLLSAATGAEFHDLGCGARAFDRRVLEEIQLYGDQHRFLALLADQLGFLVREVDVRQSPNDRHTGVYRPREYVRRLLDIVTIFFLARFTKKPLRLFGMIGVATSAIGALLIAVLVVERIGFGKSLADRPALLLSSLLVVLGLQIFALGLLGELIIFTHAKTAKDYQIERIIKFSGVKGPQ